MSTPLAVPEAAALGAAGAVGARRRGLLTIYRKEAKYEFLKLLRLPAFAIPALTFPALFYVLFAVSFGTGRQAGPVTLPTYMLATYGAFGVIGAALFGFGVGVATERGQGWMLLKRASPMPPGAYFAAKIAMSLLFGGLITALLFALGATLGHVSMAAGTWAALAGVLLAGVLPFCAFGLAIGYFAGPNSAPAVVNLLYLPLAFASGLWIPLPALPRFFQTLAPWLPPYHYAQLALKVVGADAGRSIWVHAAYLAAFTLVCLALARFGFRRDEDKTYG
jgi:ABC-2 type transport system permease protein